MQRVLIIQSEVKRYRLPFYLELYPRLQARGIQLRVLYSKSNSVHALRRDSATLPTSVGECIPGAWLFGKFLFQNVWRDVWSADLVIIGPELKFLNNPLFLLLRFLRLKKVAFWGLGPNMHATRSALAERVKRPFFICVDWWFAYTHTIKDWLIREGMPADHITDIQNSSDTSRLREELAAISTEEADREKFALCGPDSIVGLYCGFLGSIKALPLLIDTAQRVHSSNPRFHLVIVGDGPDKEWLLERIKGSPWIHYLGSLYGRDSAIYYRMADMSLMAGSVGLGVVDSFAAGLPLLATDISTHPPEISYVVDNSNGKIAPHNVEGFADVIESLIQDPEQMNLLRRGAEQSGSQYTIQAMADRYCEGIAQCLSLPGKKNRRPTETSASGTSAKAVLL